MKKFLSMAVVATLALSIVSCTGDDAEEQNQNNETAVDNEITEETEDASETEETEESSETEEVELTLMDGVYTAEQADFDAETGYKEMVEITVVDGAIESVMYDGISEEGASKAELSENGDYKMVEYGGAIAEWHEQADLLEMSVVENQGVVDAVSGVTIDTADFSMLVNEALSRAYGEEMTEEATEEEMTEETAETAETMYVDGVYTAEQAEFDAETGYKEMVEITIVDGAIESVMYDGMTEDGASKTELSENGEYKMVEYGAAIAEWHEQADLLEMSVVENQGVVDAVSGVTIDTADFSDLVNEALSSAMAQ